MQTKFFREVALSDDGKKKLKTLATVSPDTRAGLAKWIVALDSAPRIDAHLIKQLSETTGETADLVQDILAIAWFLVQHFGREQDDLAAFSKDATSAKILTEAEAGEILKFLQQLGDAPRRLYISQRKLNASSWGAPTLTSSSGCVAIKSVSEKSFDYDADDLLQYEPRIMAYQPVAQLEIVATDSAGEKQSLAFQANADNLDRFITDLLALQKELQVAGRIVSHFPLAEPKS